MKKCKTIGKLLLVGWVMINGSFLMAQNPIKIANAEVKPLNFIKMTDPVRDIVTSHDGVVVRPPRIGYHPKSDWPLNEKTNPNALPLGIDPALQKSYAPSNNAERVLLRHWEGIGADGDFSPGDPSVDVGPNHVVQMVNGVGGSNVQIWDKNGNSLTAFIFDGVTTISGGGDPIVLYDQLADRWLLSEFAAFGNTLIIAISTSPDPTGSYFIYSFNTPNFPDYPKYGIWNNSYIVTTNEANSRIYALDRTKMLAGDQSATAQQFNISDFGTLGVFQTATPVNFNGITLPPVGAPGMFMRIADDGWTGVSQDRLEIYEMSIDFNNAANSSITGPFNLATLPFDTGINGYTAFSGIPQPGTTVSLDPLREVLMNKIYYRNFGSYESLVCNHVTDVTGNDDAGIRWYELRRYGGINGSWFIYQQGTYSPDNTSRWMGSIAINDNGAIGLMYNVSNATNVFPGIRYTGRDLGDPLGQMTYPESLLLGGAFASASNRWGDYSTLSVDPVDGTFWGTAQYVPNSINWGTRVVNIEIPSNCPPNNVINATVSSSEINYARNRVILQASSIANGADPTFTGAFQTQITGNFQCPIGAGFNITLTGCN